MKRFSLYLLILVGVMVISLLSGCGQAKETIRVATEPRGHLSNLSMKIPRKSKDLTLTY